MFLEISQNSKENACARVSFLILEKRLCHTFSCEFCEISQNTFFTEYIRETASACIKAVNRLIKGLCIFPNLIIANEEDCGVQNKSLRLVLLHLTDRKQSVKINITHVIFKEIISGLPQGSNKLFQVYIRGLFLDYFS